jgi:ABC-type multidrug transport system fused ATPase/permease subunit
LTTGSAAATQILNLLITSVGRDLLSLIGLIAVMVRQDSMMSFFTFVVAPPALFVLRKMIRRIYAIARTQFHGNTQVRPSPKPGDGRRCVPQLAERRPGLGGVCGASLHCLRLSPMTFIAVIDAWFRLA